MGKRLRTVLSISGSRRHRRLRAAVAATALVTALAVPELAPTVAGATPALPGPATSLSDAFSKSAPAFAQALLCPTANTVKTVTSTVPGVNTLTDQLANLLCAIGVVGYAYRTTYYPPAGPPQVRYYHALAGVPALLDVDGNGLPDFTGLVSTALTIPGIQLGITRIGIAESARVKVEAVFMDPFDPMTWVGVGEDGSLTGTAKYWRTAIGAFLSSGTSVDLELSLFAQYAPPSLAAMGEAFFGGNPDAPTSIDAGTMSFAPVPVNFSTRLRIGPSSQQANITSTIPTTLSAHVQAIKPGNEKDVDVLIDQLPTSVEITHQTTNGHEIVNYSANAAIAHVLGAYHELAGTSILTAAQLDISDLPSALTFDQFDGKTVVNVPSGSIGLVEARYATGQDVPASPAGTSPYVAFHRFSSSRLTAGLRFANLKSVSFDQTGPYVGDVVFSTAPGFIPLSFVDDVSGITATGHLSNLPAHITVTIDLANGKVVFDGHGTGIHEIAVSATKNAGTFFTRASRIDLTIVDLPALDTINFKPDGTSASFTPSAPIGSVSLLASDGTGAPAVSGDYASYEDTPSLYRIYLQMLSIAGFSFATSPTLTATLKTGTSLPMTLFAHVADAALTHDLMFNGTIKNLPTTITVTADLDNGQLIYNASDTIDEIHVTATDSLANFFARANRLDLDIKGLPLTNTITFKPSGQQVNFTPSAPIDSVSLLASDGSNAPSVTGDYASYEDTPSLYRIYLQMVGISGLSFSAPPDGALSATIKTNSPQVMNLFAHVAGVGYDITATGSIDKLPSWIDFSVADGSGGSKVIDYNTHGQVIDHITLDASGLPLPFNANTAHVQIDHIPSHLTVTIPASGGTAVFDPHGDHINRVLVQAYPQANGPHNSVAGHQTAYANLNTGQFTADIQNIGLTKFSTGTSGINIQYDISSAPLDFRFTTEDGTQYFGGQISNPEPATITVDTSNRTEINYQVNPSSSNFTGNGEINEIDVETNLAGYLDVALQHIAPKLHICFDSGGSKPCKPGFVPQSSFQDSDGDNHNMPAALFDFQLVPTALNGSAWPTRFQLDGTYCFSETDAATCLDSGQKKERIVINDLEFGKIAAGAGYTEDGCTLCTAGRVYGYFDTDNTNISGDVKYFKDGDDGPFVHYHTDTASDGIAAQNLFLFVDFCIVCVDETNVLLITGGSFTCNGDPHMDIDIPVFDDIDVLSGSFISIC
jgi:uncharacterized membrane protein